MRRLLTGGAHTLRGDYPLDRGGGAATERAYPLDWRRHAPRSVPPGRVIVTTDPRIGAYHNPVAISLYALARHTEHTHTADAAARHAFLTHADHLVATQDERGGWRYPIAVPRYRVAPGWYSAMAQGLSVSVLLRSHAITKDDGHLTAAHRAAQLLFRSLDEGGCSHYDHAGAPFFEECPADPPSHILNGALFAVIGALEMAPHAGPDGTGAALERLVQSLPAYDLGYWSRYDLWFDAPSSYAYHRLHISLLEAIGRISRRDEFLRTAAQWRAYSRDWRRRSRAAAAKALFALRHGQ